MKTIRQGVFETNSSSTHSVTIMSKEDYNKWQSNLLLYDFYTEKFLTKEELYKEVEDFLGKDYTEEDIQEHILDNQSDYAQSYEDFHDEDYLEIDTTGYTSKSGDELVIICKYGNG